MTLESYEFRDPGELITRMTYDRPLVADTAYLVLVRKPDVEQEVVHVAHIDRSPWFELDQADRSELIRNEVDRMPIPCMPRRGGPENSIMTVVVRRGLAVFGEREVDWLLAWRYSNHLAATHSGDVCLVTEHGWSDFMSGLGGHYPRLRL